MDKNYNSLDRRQSSIFNTSVLTYLGSFTFLLILLLGQSGIAQVSSYTFAESTETYAQITGTTSTAVGDDGVQTNVPIGFSFDLGGTAYIAVGITTNGMVRLGTNSTDTAIATGWTNLLGNAAILRPLIATFWDDNNLSGGTIRYETTGSAPNRVFSVNWHDTKIGSIGSTEGASVSTLLRLYETTNVIEMVYSTPFTTVNSVSASVGLNDLTSFLSVTPAAVSTVSSGTANNSINATVMANLAGKKLTFTPPPPPACPAPNTVTVTATSATTATVSWLGASTAVVEWGASGCVAGTAATAGACGSVLSGTSPIVITGLTFGSAYSVYVRQDCESSSNGFSANTATAYTHTAGESCAVVDVLTVYPNAGAAVNTLLTTGLTSDGPNGTCSDGTGNPSKKDRWISFVAPSSGNKVIVSTSAGTLSDTVMQVWSGCPATGVALGCNDDISSSNFMSQLEFCSLTPGETYYIQIWPYSASATGNFNIRVYEDVVCPLPPSNDECAGVQTLTIGTAGSCPTNATVGTTINATATPGVEKTTCDQFGTYNDVFYKFNSGSNTEINFAFTNLTGTNEFGIYSACGTGYLGACSSTTLATTYTGLTPNTDYYIVVWANNALAAGTFSLCISQLPPPTCVTAPTSPANEATVCAGTTNFSWPAVASATSYDVFLDGNLVSDNQTGTSYSQVVAVGPHTWSIVPSNSSGSATGCLDFTFTSSPSPVGNTFVDAIDLGVLTSSTNTAGNNTTANCFTNEYSSTSTPGDSSARPSNDVFYKFEITECGSLLTVGTCTSSFDTYIHILNASGTRINGDDDACSTPNSAGSLVSGLALVPGIYYVVVEGFNAIDTGTFTLDFTYTAGTSQIPYYVDVDDDGYGVSEDFIIACEPNGNYTALVAGDCNDNNPLINPGAEDICFDGIDNDCSGTANNNCNVVVNVTPSLQNTTLASISSGMSAVPYSYPGAQSIGYRFLITNKTASPNVSVEYLSSSRFFSLTQAGIAAYSSEYEIRATAIVNGQLAAHSGNTITVFTPGAPTIPLSSFTCGSQLSRLNETLSATPAFGATAYRFRIRLTSDTENPTYGYSQSSTRFVSASSFALESSAPFVLNYSNSYAVAVQYLSLNNNVSTWTDFGPECTITTPAIPLIALASPSCGSQVSSNGATLSAQAAINANQYRFRIRLTSETENPTYGYTLPSASRFSQLSAFQGFTLTPGTSYSVAAEYRLVNNGEEVWSGFGAECVIISAGDIILIRPEAPVEVLPASINEAFTAIAYPNPFSDAFNLEIKSIGTAPLQIVVYDMTGRLLEHKSMSVEQANSSSIGSGYPSGVYQVVVSQGDQLQTVRVIKQ